VDETQVGADPIDLTLTSIPGGSLAGTTLGGRYRLIRLIGAGGMAQVWEGTDEVLNRNVAIKVLHPHLANDESLVRRFRQEAIAAARLNDPGIVGVYDTCSDGGHEAIVMELLQATTLRALIDERGTIDSDTTTRIGLRLLDALEAAHRAGLVHRDVKPSNILLCDDGRVKIADFGIAKADDHTELTREGSLLGTASYLAPEQLTGVAVDGRADLYAAAIVLFASLTGRLPFPIDGKNEYQVRWDQVHTAPIPFLSLATDAPPALGAFFDRALAKDRDARFPDGIAMGDALLAASGMRADAGWAAQREGASRAAASRKGGTTAFSAHAPKATVFELPVPSVGPVSRKGATMPITIPPVPAAKVAARTVPVMPTVPPRGRDEK
jgi:serine/threonine-protein kinase